MKSVDIIHLQDNVSLFSVQTHTAKWFQRHFLLILCNSLFLCVATVCVSYQVKADGSKLNIYSDTARVGHNISTKSVGSKKRLNITDSYKYREGEFAWRTHKQPGMKSNYLEILKFWGTCTSLQYSHLLLLYTSSSPQFREKYYPFRSTKCFHD